MGVLAGSDGIARLGQAIRASFTSTIVLSHWDALHALMSRWSKQHDKQWIADAAQHAHVPSFPLRDPAELLVSPQLAHRRFYPRN